MDTACSDSSSSSGDFNGEDSFSEDYDEMATYNEDFGVRPYMFEAMTKKKTGAEDGEVEHGSMGDHRDIGEIGHLQNVEW